MSNSLCRWGILSTANIGRKNWRAITLSGNGVVQAVSSRSEAKAKTYIDECMAEVPLPVAPQAFGSHQELLESDQIDAVYIPLPTGLRKEWVLEAAKAGKHVLIEKPVADTLQDAIEMRDACKQAGVQFMDGVMFDHSKRISEVANQLEGGSIGTLRRIQAHFSFNGDDEFQQDNIRTDMVLEKHGCLGDLGWYCIRFILWASAFRDPVRVSARTVTKLQRPGSDDWVPGQFAAEFEYEDGLTAGFFCSFMTANQQLASVSGTDGYLTLDDYVLPLFDSKLDWQIHRHDLQIDNCTWNFLRRSEPFYTDEFHGAHGNAQEVNMMRAFADIVCSGQLNDELADRAIKTQRLLDACRLSDSNGGAFIALDSVG